jgi:hypothetical protein
MIVEMLKYMVLKKSIPQIWKTAKTILIYKGGDENNPGNWRSITLTSVVYRVIFGRISQIIINMEEPTKKQYYLFHKKDSFPELTDVENILLLQTLQSTEHLC